MKTTLICITAFIYAGCVYSQQQNGLMNQAATQMANKQVTVNQLLADAEYMQLHVYTVFREMIKQHADTGKLVLVGKNEPGKKITVKGKLQTRRGKPISNALVYVYQTCDKGWYSDTAAHVLQGEGDMGHARLFGYLKTSASGEFEFETIQPRGYPNSNLPAHIHIAAWKEEQRINIAGELLFDDDPRLTSERRKDAANDGYLVEKNTGTDQRPVYFYRLIQKE
jgi:protocatechuate 3,4-dioxygenase beta subunit